MPQSLQDEQLEESILTLLKSSDARSQWLTLEVTERAMMTNPARAKAILSRLHEIGVRISIDDFGTGYSSLAYLTEFPVDEVKVDQSFVKEMVVNERDACIVRAVIDLGHNLGLRVVAEGVEDRASLELLASWGCDLAQGFYVSRPLPPAELNDWMGTSTKKCLAHAQRACDPPMSSPRPSSGRRLHPHAETIPKSRSLYHIERRLGELLESRTFWPSVSAFVALFVSRFLKRRQHDFGDQARIDEMLRVLACIERDFAPADRSLRIPDDRPKRHQETEDHIPPVKHIEESHHATAKLPAEIVP